MRIILNFCIPAFIIILLTGCGHKHSNRNQTSAGVRLSGIDYPETPENSLVKLSKYDFPTGKISSIEQIPLDMIIE